MMEEYAVLIEIRGLYDGWSVGVKHDGTMVNRWSPEDKIRHERTQQFIDSYGGRYDLMGQPFGDRPIHSSSEIHEQESVDSTTNQ